MNRDEIVKKLKTFPEVEEIWSSDSKITLVTHNGQRERTFRDIESDAKPFAPAGAALEVCGKGSYMAKLARGTGTLLWSRSGDVVENNETMVERVRRIWMEEGGPELGPNDVDTSHGVTFLWRHGNAVFSVSPYDEYGAAQSDSSLRESLRDVIAREAHELAGKSDAELGEAVPGDPEDIPPDTDIFPGARELSQLTGLEAVPLFGDYPFVHDVETSIKAAVLIRDGRPVVLRICRSEVEAEEVEPSATGLRRRALQLRSLIIRKAREL